MFHVRFDPAEVPNWAARYLAGSTPSDMRRESDIEQRVVPAVKARGYLTKPEFIDICHWKSRRPKRLYAQNSEEFVETATGTALSTSSEQLRIEVLTLLSGVSWPVASAILHWIQPDPSPILDFRALWSLGWSQNAARTAFSYDFDEWPRGVTRAPFVYDFEHWREYDVYCRRLRQQCGITMRELDRALWQFAKENMP